MLDRVKRERVSKVKALAARPGTAGEAQAAVAALSRLTVNSDDSKRGRLTDAIANALPTPSSGNRITYDVPRATGRDYVPGFGVRVTSKGHRSFILNYRNRDGVERRYTIGSPPTWSVAAARDEAKSLRREIDTGHDPMAAKRAAREAETMNDLCDKFEAEYLPKKRPSTQAEYKAMLKNEIRPALGRSKVATITFNDVEKLHNKITTRGNPYRANRVAALLSRIFSLAVKWEFRTDNPAKGIERNPEAARKRYLSGDELKRLSEALVAHEDEQAADIVRLLLLTGARRGEVLTARWNQFDLEKGVWTKPGATTKQKTDHRVPLSAPAIELLKRLRNDAPEDAECVFPGRVGDHRASLTRAWSRLCKTARIEGARVHDLRHTFASVLASEGLSLPVIGALLGHTQAQTTQRYVHLFDDPLRAATEKAGNVLAGESRSRPR